MDLLLMAHAGGSSLVFNQLFKNLPLTLRPLELPGHSCRFSEKLLDSLDDMVDDLNEQALKILEPDCPFAIFGHSMGGLLSYLLTLRLIKSNLMPAHLFISSAPTPGFHKFPVDLVDRPDEQFWQFCYRFFGFQKNPRLEKNREMLDLFCLILRTDLRAVVNYRHPPTPALTVPATVIYGDSDYLDSEDMARWLGFFETPPEFHCLSGNHFHVLDSPEPVSDIIESVLKPVIGQS